MLGSNSGLPPCAVLIARIRAHSLEPKLTPFAAKLKTFCGKQKKGNNYCEFSRI